MSENILYGLTLDQWQALNDVVHGQPIGNLETLRYLINQGYIEEEPERRVDRTVTKIIAAVLAN